jgi:(1->4)-alpha-D-glucan 1-alpha-D-glucosylmutase
MPAPTNVADAALRARAEALGIETSYLDVAGVRKEAPRATLEALVAAIGDAGAVPSPADDPRARADGSRCFLPDAIAGTGRAWGFAAALYAVRSSRNWGIGDFTDLAALVEIARTSGAALVGINPLHRLFADRPEQASPYSPSDRTALNALYLDVEAIPEFAHCTAARKLVESAGFTATLASLRASTLVDYTGVTAAKRAVLDLLHTHFHDAELAGDTPRGRAFRAWQTGDGAAMRPVAIFETIRGARARAGEILDWRDWPRELRDAAGPGVAAFAAAHSLEVERHAYVEWCARDQLAAVAAKARALAIGLYLDVAVGADPAGAEAWRTASLAARDVAIGAPPDEFNPLGQDWGLVPFLPARLRDTGFAPIAAMLRAAMRDAGAVRIDHVMGLVRQFWIPRGAPPAAGAYVRYPRDALFDVVARESVRARCAVVGEDLGTLPQGLPQALAARAILSYRLLYFEREANGAFRRSADYPRDALVAATTHDLATLAGWWRGDDIALRDDLGLFPSQASRDVQRRERVDDRARLLARLAAEGFLPAAVDAPTTPAAMPPGLALAVHRFLAATPSRIAVAQVDDMLDVREQMNVPSTTDDVHPNWRRKLTLPVEDWTRDPRIARTFAALRAERP